MKRRPFLALSLLIVAAALVQAAFVPASTPADFRSNVPPGTVCTVCGPIPTGVCELPRSTFDVSATPLSAPGSAGGLRIE
jgi:hypothetical protein